MNQESNDASPGQPVIEKGPCPSDETIEKFLIGKLDAADTERFEQHFLACPTCVERLEAQESFLIHFKAVAPEFEVRRSPSPVRQSFWSRAFGFIWGRPALVFGATLALALAVFVPTRRSAPEVAVDLVLRRGLPADDAATVPAGNRLNLTLDVSELPLEQSYAVEFISADGSTLASGRVNPQDGKLHWKTGLTGRSGLYWVRVYRNENSKPGELLREFALRVR